MTVELATSLPGVTIRRLVPADAGVLLALVQKNRAHLTRHGDFAELVDRDLDATTQHLETSPEHAFGVFTEGSLVGAVSLIPVEPPRYGCGFWLAERASGLGIASAAIRTLLDYARRELSASDVFAGVTHGNVESVAVLERTGFRRIDHFETYTRFHRRLAE
ncbi:GNAT family N-acetyltransferase [Lysobacter korlensis]|uniref:GNAT family N-acetyltransferase n=1 Tax=Lysobacter korlensis TaxID=553636 RepID=A0ABV6RSU6_9GAMM